MINETKIHRRWLSALLLGLMCGHIVPVFTPVTLFHICVLMAVVVAVYEALRFNTRDRESLATKERLHPRLFYLVTSFFIIYGFWTTMATFIWQQETDLKDIVEFLFIPLLVISLLWLMMKWPREALKQFFIATVIYYVLMTAMGYAEIISGWHLATSSLNGTSTVGATGLSYNVNDYTVLLVLSALFIFAYCDRYRGKKSHLWGLLALGLAFPLSVWNDCKCAMAIIVVAVAFHCSHLRPADEQAESGKRRAVSGTVSIIQ